MSRAADGAFYLFDKFRDEDPEFALEVLKELRLLAKVAVDAKGGKVAKSALRGLDAITRRTALAARVNERKRLEAQVLNSEIVNLNPTTIDVDTSPKEAESSVNNNGNGNGIPSIIPDHTGKHRRYAADPRDTFRGIAAKRVGDPVSVVSVVSNADETDEIGPNADAPPDSDLEV